MSTWLVWFYPPLRNGDLIHKWVEMTWHSYHWGSHWVTFFRRKMFSVKNTSTAILFASVVGMPWHLNNIKMRFYSDEIFIAFNLLCHWWIVLMYLVCVVVARQSCIKQTAETVAEDEETKAARWWCYKWRVWCRTVSLYCCCNVSLNKLNMLLVVKQFVILPDWVFFRCKFFLH